MELKREGADLVTGVNRIVVMNDVWALACDKHTSDFTETSAHILSAKDGFSANVLALLCRVASISAEEHHGLIHRPLAREIA